MENGKWKIIKLTLIISTILLFQTLGFGQDVCIKITPVEYVIAGKTLTLKANLFTASENQPLKFTWELSNGVKQVTDKQVVVIPISKEDSGKEIEINLTIEGLPNNCLKRYQIFVPIIPPRIPIRDPEWLFITNFSWNDEKLRLLGYVEELKTQENATLYIIIRIKNPKSKKIRNRQQRIKGFLTNAQKVDKEKFKITVAKSEVERTEYWIVPKGAELPTN